MRPLRWLSGYSAHPDPVTAACNRIALLIAWSQPSYPLYVWWLVGGAWQVTFWTFLSTPFFAAVPAVARRSPLAGRILLPLTAIANGIVSAKAFGIASGVEWFLLPTLLIVIFAFRGHPRVMLGLGLAVFAVALPHAHYGAPFGHFSVDQYASFRRLNLYSVAILCCVIPWTFMRARRSSASPDSRRSPPFR